MGNNILVTAWNDSGAGYLMRCLDDSPGVFSYPFEVLLGAPVKAGIKELPDLVKPGYRWNIFRDQQDLYNYWNVNPPQKFSDIFEESELEAWITGNKFSDLQEIRSRVAQGLRSKYHNENLSSFFTPAYIEKYLDELESQFSTNPLPAMSRVLHCPCLMLDAQNPLFSRFFAKVITVTIDPAWGFGNMHQRNGISLDRYLERWRAVNMASLIAVTNSPGTVLSIQTSPFPEQNLLNSKRAYEWITGGSCEACHLTPTLLGQPGQSDGYPYGGLWAVNPEAAASAKATTESVLVEQGGVTKNAYDECQWIFEQISAR
jgi:hypothetical protein